MDADVRKLLDQDRQDARRIRERERLEEEEHRVSDAKKQAERERAAAKEFDLKAKQVVDEFLDVMRAAGNPGSTMFWNVGTPVLTIIVLALGAAIGSWVVRLIAMPGWLGAVIVLGFAVWGLELRFDWFVPVRRGWEFASGTDQQQSSTGWGYGPISHWRIYLSSAGNWYKDDERIHNPPGLDLPVFVNTLGSILRRNGLEWRSHGQGRID